MDYLLHISLLVLGVVGLTMCFVLADFQSVSFQEDRNLSDARRLIALSFLALSANSFAHDYWAMEILSPSVGIALDISSYFLIAILLSFAYIPLIDPTYLKNTKRKWFHIGSWLVSSVCLWVAAIFTYGGTTKILLSIVGLLCFSSILLIFTDFMRRYRKESNMLTDSDVDTMGYFSRFMYRSVVIVACIGLASVVVTLFGNAVWKSYFHLFSAIMFFQLGMSFVNFVTNKR